VRVPPALRGGLGSLLWNTAAVVSAAAFRVRTGSVSGPPGGGGGGRRQVGGLPGRVAPGPGVGPIEVEGEALLQPLQLYLPTAFGPEPLEHSRRTRKVMNE
jgi:hypothetical protein